MHTCRVHAGWRIARAHELEDRHDLPCDSQLVCAIVQNWLIDSGRVLSMQYPTPFRFVRNRREWSSDYVRPLQFGGGGEARRRGNSDVKQADIV